MADGQVLIESKLDTGGVTKGANKIEKEFEQLAKVTKRTADIMEKELKGVDASKVAEGMADSFEAETKSVEQALDRTADVVEKNADRMSDAMQDSADDQADAMRKAWDKTEDKADSSSRKVREDIDNIGDKAKSTGIDIENSLGKAFSGLATKLAGAISAIAAGGELFEFAKESIELGSALSEVQNVVDVTFGEEGAAVINKFSKNAIKQFGLSELSAKKFSSTLGAMFKSMGDFDEAEIIEMSTALTGLAGDMASFYNLDAQEAFDKLRSGISGETDPLKQLGINLSVANLEAYALANGIEKSYNQMTEQEKALLRYNYILATTADAQGDFANTQDSWANQTRILAEEFNSLKGTLGQGLINVLNPIVTSINSDFMPVLQDLADQFVSMSENLDIFEGLGKLDLSKAKNSLKGFTDSASKLGGTIGSALSGVWEDVLVPLGTWTIEEGGPALLDALSASFDFLGATLEYLEPIGQTIWNDFLSPLGEWTGDVVVGTLDAVATGFTNLATAAETSTTTAAEVITSTWETTAHTTESGFIIPTHDQMFALHESIKEWFSNAADDIANNFTATATTLDNGFIVPTSEDMETLGTLISEAFSNAADSLKEAWDGISQWFDSNVAQPIQTAIEEFVNNALEKWAELETAFSNVWENIKTAAQNALNAIQGWINNLTGKDISINVNKTGNVSPTSYSGYDGEAYTPTAITPQIPYLASGAVIPPNAPFLAMLGDQRNGKNIEAPMETIKQGVREVLDEMGFDVNINFVGELSQLMRILYPHIEIERKRKGTSLAEGNML